MTLIVSKYWKQTFLIDFTIMKLLTLVVSQYFAPLAAFQYPLIVFSRLHIIRHHVGWIRVMVTKHREDGGVWKDRHKFIGHITNQSVDFLLIEISIRNMRYTVTEKQTDIYFKQTSLELQVKPQWISPSSTKKLSPLDILVSRPGLSSIMHILREYTTALLSPLRRWCVCEKYGQTDRVNSYITPQNCFFAEGIRIHRS